MPRSLTVADAERALRLFERREVARGRAYQEVGRVRGLAREPSSQGEDHYSASVQGTARQPYRVSLRFEARTGGLRAADCSCPVGYYCKHCAATLCALTQNLRPAPPAPPARLALAWTPPPTPARGPRLDPKVETWLAALTEYGRPRPVRTRTEALEERLLYVLSLLEDGVRPPLIQLRLARAMVLADGTFGLHREIYPEEIDWVRDRAVSPGDHALVTQMGSFEDDHVPLVGASGARLLSGVVATGRSFLETDDGPLNLLDGASRTGALAFTTDPRGWQQPTLTLEGAGLLLVVSPLFYLDAASGEVGRVVVPDVRDELAYAWTLGTAIPPDVAPLVAGRLAAVQGMTRLPAPRTRRVREIKGDPKLVLRLESEGRAEPRPGSYYTPPQPERPWAQVFFDYGGERVDPTLPTLDHVTDDEVVTVRRSPEREATLVARAAEAGLLPVERMQPGRLYPPGLLLTMSTKVSPFAMASKVAALASSDVEVEKAPDYAYDPVLADDVQLDLDELPGSLDHFAVTLGIRVGDETVAALPLVLAALRQRVPEEGEALLVPLPDGRVVEVPAARLLPLRRLLVELLAEGSRGRVSRVRALALDPAVVARSPASLAELRAELTSPRRVAVPKTLKATLRPYQREGFVWLMARRRVQLGAVLADDMGLGKTVQTLALLLAEDRGGVPSLVVCPKSVLGNWEAEAQRFAPSLRLHVHHGPDRAAKVDAISAVDVVLTTYPLLVRDRTLFDAHRFATVVLDEAQTIKSAAASLTHAACALRADFRLALSGTPMENHLGELWSVMRFTLPELFGDSRAFARAFRKPIERDGSEPARRELVTRLSPFILRRKKEEVATELPPKTVVIEPVDLDDAQRDVYETVRVAMDARVREALAEHGVGKSHIIVLDALLKLRQVVCDPRLLRLANAKKAGSAKLDLLVLKLRELVDEGRRVLVFSQFVTMLELVQAELRREKIPFLVLTGQTENRTAVVAAFQRGDAPVFLLSLKAGGTGLNLTAADVVIHYDPWWNPAAEAQATDRAHRIGQDKAVLVYKLVGRGTIEEKILALQDRKRALFTSVLDDGAGAAKKLTAADVEFLFAR